MPKLINSISVVGFDLDGTLIDTAPDIGAAANMMLALLGSKALADSRFPALIGLGVEEFVAGALEESLGGAKPRPELHATAVSLFSTLYRQCIHRRSRVYPGVTPALRMLRRIGIRLCCITNKSRGFAQPLLEATKLDTHFELTLCADRIEDRKPNPNLLLAACAQLDIEPSKMLYVGDSGWDIAAGHRAGCPVAAVDYGYHRGLPLAALGPNWIVHNLLEIASLRVPSYAGALAARVQA